MFALVVKKLYVTSSPQCYFKDVPQKNAEMPMHQLLAYPKRISDFVRAAKYLEEINILKSKKYIKLISYVFQGQQTFRRLLCRTQLAPC